MRLKVVDLMGLCAQERKEKKMAATCLFLEG